jgi:hypothetical protein
MVLAHTIASTGVLGTSDGLGESGIDDVGVELTDGHFGFDEMVRAGRVGKDDGAVGVGRVRGQAKESGKWREGCQRVAMNKVRTALNLPVSLILSQESRRTRPPTRSRPSPKDVVHLVMPGDFHIIDLLDDHVRRVPSVRVPLGGRVIVVRRD